MNTHKHLSQLIESAIDHDIPTPVQRGGRSLPYNIALRLSLSSVPLGLPLWASLSAFFRFSNTHPFGSWASLSAFSPSVLHKSLSTFFPPLLMHD
jgi:hypothetical protein